MFIHSNHSTRHCASPSMIDMLYSAVTSHLGPTLQHPLGEKVLQKVICGNQMWLEKDDVAVMEG